MSLKSKQNFFPLSLPISQTLSRNKLHEIPSPNYLCLRNSQQPTNKLGLEFKQLCSLKPTFSWRFRQW
ncbi:hypothetical protein P8452_72176 [Trifolium repens]|nr:hypothetical protein P8452_72176 [Trifolium repens]